MKKVFILFTIILFGLSMLDCTSDAQGDSSPTKMEFTTLHSSENLDSGLFTSKGSKVLTSQNDYETEFLIYSNDDPASINFSENKVLLIDMGKRASGGYSISVTKIEEYSKYVIATILFSVPGENCITTTALTNPFQFIEIPTKKEILINEEITINNCE